MRLIVGLDDFGEAAHSRLDFIDKSLFIKEIFGSISKWLGHVNSAQVFI